jgi:uncharacterized protein (DUF433 family)
VKTRRQNDPRERPLYSVAEIAAYVRMNRRTLATWVSGRGSQPSLIRRPIANDPRLSYNNLIEAYVLNALRKHVGVSMPRIRRGLEYVERSYGIEKFLLSDQLRARRGNLLIEALGELVNVGERGQAEIPEVVSAYLRRIEYRNGLPARLHPVTRTDDPQGPQKIVILPDVGFGRPITTRGHVSVAVIKDRFRAGESIPQLAADYGLDSEDIEEAIRTESVPLAA